MPDTAPREDDAAPRVPIGTPTGGAVEGTPGEEPESDPDLADEHDGATYADQTPPGLEEGAEPETPKGRGGYGGGMDLSTTQP